LQDAVCDPIWPQYIPGRSNHNNAALKGVDTGSNPKPWISDEYVPLPNRLVLHYHRRMESIEYMTRSRDFYAAQGFEKAYVWAHFDDVPFTPLRKSLAESTLALMTTASLYDRTPGDRREVASAGTGFPPERLYGNDLSWDKKTTHLEDRNSYFPINALKADVGRGRIGALAKRFHCLPTSYSQRQTLDVDGPEVVRRCLEDGVDVALLVPI
jgi:hypothetical protein